MNTENKMVDLVNEVYGDALKVFEVTEGEEGFRFYIGEQDESFLLSLKEKTEDAWIKLVQNGYGEKFVPSSDGPYKRVSGGVVIFDRIKRLKQ